VGAAARLRALFAIDRALTGERVVLDDVRMPLPAGGEHQRRLRVAAGPIRGSDGGVIGAVALASDLTTLRNAEEDRDAFLNLAAHEIRSPLTSMKAYADAIVRTVHRGGGGGGAGGAGAGGHAAALSPGAVAGRDTVASMAARIGAQVDRLARLLDDLIDVARLGTGNFRVRPEIVDLRGVITEQVDQVRVGLRHAVAVDLPGHPVFCEVDRDRFAQVLTNLLSNACKYSDPTAQVGVALAERGGECVLTVRDHGVGIPADELPRIFSRYHRARTSRAAAGLGLGLYVTAEIVRIHRGRIEVTSREGQGSTFRVYLRSAHGPMLTDEPGDQEPSGPRMRQVVPPHPLRRAR
jgi:signal transduction histidine kinase